MCSVSALHTGKDSTNESNCGTFGSLPSELLYIICQWQKEFAWICHLGTIQVQAWLYINLIDVFRYKLHSFFEFRICWTLFQMAPSLQLVVQYGSQTVLPFRFYKERVLWLIAEYYKSVSTHGNVVAFSRFFRENRDRWSSHIWETQL